MSALQSHRMNAPLLPFVFDALASLIVGNQVWRPTRSISWLVPAVPSWMKHRGNTASAHNRLGSLISNSTHSCRKYDSIRFIVRLPLPGLGYVPDVEVCFSAFSNRGYCRKFRFLIFFSYLPCHGLFRLRPISLTILSCVSSQDTSSKNFIMFHRYRREAICDLCTLEIHLQTLPPAIHMSIPTAQWSARHRRRRHPRGFEHHGAAQQQKGGGQKRVPHTRHSQRYPGAGSAHRRCRWRQGVMWLLIYQVCCFRKDTTMPDGAAEEW